MATYSVEVDLSFCDEVCTHYINVEANSQHEAHVKALEWVKNSMDIRAEVKPIKMEDNNE
jgi:hypothetical protein